MPLSIRIISSPDGENITEWNKSFPEEGGDIGRSFGSTLQLSDASRELSNTHAIIRKSGRGYHIMDNSSNGLFINGSDLPLGKGNQVPLNDGDVLDMGRFRLLVSCFVPSQAKLLNAPFSENDSEITDDPFAAPSIENSSNVNGVEVEEEPIKESRFTISDYEVVEDDPFTGAVELERSEAKPLDTGFEELDDDPFADMDMSPDFSQLQESAIAPSSKPISWPEQTLSAEQDPFTQGISSSYEADLDQAIEMALSRLLKDLEPENLQSMFDELATPGLFSRQPKYWDLYKRYYKRQLNSRDLQVKFRAYVQDSLRTQKKLEGDK